MTQGEKLEQLELVEVVIKEGKATLQFIDMDRGELREVIFNKNVFDKEKNKFVPDEEKAAKVEEWCQEYFQLTFDDLSKAVGEKRDVYAYDKFNSLWESEQIAKFDKDMVGQIISSTVKDVTDDGIGVHIKFEYEGELYQSNMTYSDYMETMKKWFTNPQKQRKQYEKFEEKFGISIDNKEELIGKDIMVEVKSAFGKFVYPDIKPFPKKKK
ncbi:hypothetical protein ACVYQX_000504 [Listeria monocytogenes]|uniref:hypothetical protein n=1 Tax=Listeria monocytogenes TaxID=1639 RepID=UPI0011EACC6C|nr:hypothetical protein [Listeria monocytogenes]EAE8591300.1 hypothetical protein [Listeria monocytogenes]EAF5198086.1 hypothetical protein [Listeria monocytogenes]EDH0970666.1 hypothetical protein [Listeria monocytogenes]EHG1764836.1 hypothetical protein [Listeria monocytogenes]TYU83366.1 hypothetical protein FZW81_06095 [Listeria monocytogenes]